MCGEGIPLWVYRRAVELSRFNSSDPSKRFPAPLPWKLARDKTTGLPSLGACLKYPFFGYYASLSPPSPSPLPRDARLRAPSPLRPICPAHAAAPLF